ncbi:MAG: beta-ketoacyl reductase, partial [Methylomonas sp.]|nr:beta-ketoacyl reductase [Methylomonas sp.]
SATALLGAPGQGNYAAANAFQDALAHYRHRQGLPALSINWGPWGQVGMAARLSAQAGNHWLAQGIEPVEPQAALQALLQALDGDSVQLALMKIDWRQYATQHASAFLSNLAQTAPKPRALSFIDQLHAEPAEQRRDFLNDWLREQVCEVLALPKTTPVEPRERLFDFGLDSLMAVELKNRLDHAVGNKLRSTLIFDYPTLETLGNHLAEQLQIAQKNEPPLAEQTSNVEALFELGDLLDALENRSDEEITQQLMN